MNQHSLRVIILDFDGTIVESNHIKDNAFDKIFSDWPTYKKTMMKWHLASNTIDRREKFRYFVEEVLNMPENDKLINKLTDRFSILTKKLIIDCTIVEGAKECLEYIQKRVMVYLISATPQFELNEIIEERGLGLYFIEVYGAPINKLKILKKIMMVEKASADKILFIGDSPEDQLAAESLAIHFIGRQSDRELNGVTYSVYTDFIKIKDHLDQNYQL